MENKGKRFQSILICLLFFLQFSLSGQRIIGLDNQPIKSYLVGDESIQVTTTGTGIRAPHITKKVTSGYFIAWAVPGDIYVTNSTDGETWADPRLAESSVYDMHGADICQTSDGTFWIAARRNNGGDEEVYIFNSTDGVAWTAPTLIVDTASLDSWPRITATSDDNLLVMFTHGGSQVQVVNSTDGISWSTPTTISSGKWGDIHVANDDTIYACYESGGDVYVKHSVDGVTWSEGIEIMSVYPSFGGSLTDMGNGSVLCLAGAQGTSLMYMCRTNDGDNWSNPLMVYDGDDIDYPDITYDDSGNAFATYLDDNNIWIRKINMSTLTFIIPNPPITDHPEDIEFFYGAGGYNITWNTYDENPQAYEIYQNGTPIIFQPWSVGDWNLTVTLEGLDIGIHNYTLNLIDSDGHNTTDTVLVTVLQDTEPPTVDNPFDITYTEGKTGNNITWNPEDNNPCYYIVFRNGSIIKVGSWNSTTDSIIVDVDGLSVGVYNYTLLASDCVVNVTDIVIVTVTPFDSELPSIDHPNDIVYTEGGKGYNITWSPNSENPQSYILLRNSTIIRVGKWNSSSEYFTINIPSLEPSVYNFTLWVNETSGNFVKDEVIVTIKIDQMPPTITHPSDVSIELGTSGRNITWTAIDLNPSYFEVYLNGSLLFEGLWNSSTEPLILQLEDVGLGTYNYTLRVGDIRGNNASDSVIVSIVDTIKPILNHPPDIHYFEDFIGNRITWSPYDLSPYSYEVQQNGTAYISGSWNSSTENILISVDDLYLGIYNYTLFVNDTSGNYASDTVIVTVTDGTPPTINTPSDITFYEGELGYFIRWQPMDSHPLNYEVFLNETPLIAGEWNESTEMIDISLDGLSVGSYNFTIRVMDIGQNVVSDTVWVTVAEIITTTTTTGETTETTTTTTPTITGIFEEMGIITIVITLGSLVVIIVFSIKICRGRKDAQWNQQMQYSG